MQALYDVPAPAKLNLFLHITGRRADGYHLLQSVFMLIDWQDRLNFELRADGQISREDLTTPLPADDLTVRAAQRAANPDRPCRRASTSAYTKPSRHRPAWVAARRTPPVACWR